MKTKTLMAMAALALLVALPARAQQVVSANTVGYEKITLGHVFTMCSAQFRAVGDVATDTTLASVVLDGATGLNEDWDLGAALLMWNGSSYVGNQYYWVGDNTDFECKWVTDQYESADDVVIEAGTAFWIQDNNITGSGDVHVTVSGEVVSGAVPAAYPITHVFEMVGNPYPVAVKLGDIIVSGKLTGLNEDWDLGAALLMWNGSSYVGNQYYWVGDNTDFECKWVTDQYESADDVEVPVGGAFWIQDNNVSGTATISFPKPAGLD